MSDDDQQRYEWLQEAHATVQGWEAERNGPMLSIAEAWVLAEHIARALRRPFDKGAAQSA